MDLKEQRQIEIIEAAIKVFGRHGFHNAKVEEIAKTAGIGKGTVYEYFKSKKDLFEKMIQHMGEIYLSMIGKSMGECKTTREKLIAFADYHGKFISKYMDVAENIMPRAGLLSEEMRRKMIEVTRSIHLLIEEAVEEGISEGELRPDLDKKAAVFSIIGTVNYNYTMLVYFKNMDPKNIDTASIVDTIFYGLSSNS